MMWSDLADYIIQNYLNATRIVEVGVGCFPRVAIILKDCLGGEVIMTDIKPCLPGVVQDDIIHPDLKIYKQAKLIYSIRPPEELHPHLQNLSENVGADLIIKPFSSETINTHRKMKLINYKKATFYKMCSP